MASAMVWNKPNSQAVGTDTILNAADHLARDPDEHQGQHQRGIGQDERTKSR